MMSLEFAKKSIESYFYKSRPKSRRIYLLLLSILVIALCSLPFIYINVSVGEVGVVRPIIEKTTLYSPITEFIDSVFAKENKVVNKGDTILTFQRINLESMIAYQEKRIKEMEDNIHDLQNMVNGSSPFKFRSVSRNYEYNLFLQQKAGYEATLKRLGKGLDRKKILYDENLISEDEYETCLFAYYKGQNELLTFTAHQVTQWNNDMNGYINSIDEMKISLLQNKKEMDNYVICSPVKGSVEQLQGVYHGSLLQVGILVVAISPDSKLYVEVYVSPQHIAYIFLDMTVKIQVFAFDYTEWGTMLGKVTEISSDVLTDTGKGKSFYKVKCSFSEDYLIRKDGMKGWLKKGMGVSVHFMNYRESLFNLLYKKVDRWVNPTQNYEKEN